MEATATPGTVDSLNQTICHAVGQLWDRLDAKEFGSFDPLVTAHLMDSLLTGRGGKPRFLAKPRKTAPEAARVLFERLQWHGVIGGSTGSLWGPMGSSFRVGREVFDNLDTVATLLGIALGRKTHSDTWRKALGYAG